MNLRKQKSFQSCSLNLKAKTIAYRRCTSFEQKKNLFMMEKNQLEFKNNSALVKNRKI